MTPLEIVGAASAAAGAVTSVSGLALLIVRGERRTRRAVNRIVGDGVTPAALDRLDALEIGIEGIRRQLSPDHGGSLHDVVVEIRTLVRDQGRRLDDHIASPHLR